MHNQFPWSPTETPRRIRNLATMQDMSILLRMHRNLALAIYKNKRTNNTCPLLPAGNFPTLQLLYTAREALPYHEVLEGLCSRLSPHGPIDHIAVGRFGTQVRGRSLSPLRCLQGKHRALCSVGKQSFAKFLRLHRAVGLEAGSRGWRLSAW